MWQCCSQWGYCGTSDEYCGAGSQQGPYDAPPATNDVSVVDIVTPKFFNGILNQADASCVGKNFYSRSAFLDALGSFSQFGRTGAEEDTMREIAAFFAHNFNYGPDRNIISFDKLNAPATVANYPIIAFKIALRFWTNNVQSLMNQGFGATIRAINDELECDGGNPSIVQSRIRYFSQYYNQLRVSTGDNLTC
ncbi:hypothetical protein WN944_015985 [Citrus x changshan-huyou]|uniref:Glycoside hydrolase family 19 catalytic domain-containing protein n=1 Tax=Citrus x changshan-huyou TaxID=2935761 RepID=A0AAP0MCU8_9ROSI